MTYELAKQLKEAEFPEVFVPMGLMMVKNKDGGEPIK
jgi:formylmethanofuran dehydrogenase subunit B